MPVALSCKAVETFKVRRALTSFLGKISLEDNPFGGSWNCVSLTSFNQPASGFIVFGWPQDCSFGGS